MEEQKKMGRPRNGQTLICPVCNSSFYRRASLITRYVHNFCSKKCRGSFYSSTILNSPERLQERKEKMTGSNNRNWKGGQVQSRSGTLVRQPKHRLAWSNGYVPLKYLIINENFKLKKGAHVKIVSEKDYQEGRPTMAFVYRGILANKPKGADILIQKGRPYRII